MFGALRHHPSASWHLLNRRGVVLQILSLKKTWTFDTNVRISSMNVFLKFSQVDYYKYWNHTQVDFSQHCSRSTVCTSKFNRPRVRDAWWNGFPTPSALQWWHELRFGTAAGSAYSRPKIYPNLHEDTYLYLFCWRFPKPTWAISTGRYVFSRSTNRTNCTRRQANITSANWVVLCAHVDWNEFDEIEYAIISLNFPFGH